MRAPAARFAALILGVLAGACGGDAGDDETTGAALFARYCASCHGAEGRGDGLVAPLLSVAPPDLTRLELDVPELMKAIDGTRTVRAHGSAAMPVWGQVFEGELLGEAHARRTALLQVQALAEHVHGLRAR